MSAFGTKVVAVLDTQSAFGVTIKTMRDQVQTLMSDVDLISGSSTPGFITRLDAVENAIEDLDTRVAALEAEDHSHETHIHVGPQAPSGPTVGVLWFNSITLNLNIYIDDGNSFQWVQI